MKPDNFTGASVVITGGNSGMGRAIAQAFVSSGARVVVGDVSGEPPPGVIYRETDVSQPQSVRELIELAVSRHGRIDILVNNAGINGALVPLAEQTEASIDAVLDINLKGVIHGLKYALIEMSKQRAGVIVNIASVQGIRPIYAGASIYAASKAAVVSLTRSAAHEYGQYGVRIVALAPGPIDTPMLRRADPEGRIVDAVPLHRIGSGEDIANAVLWLASDAAAYVSGSLLTVDGAFLAA
jgi:NAD(P)-dependent dehydrogenase (short-subunit alcohol dehydrogenase family)